MKWVRRLVALCVAGFALVVGSGSAEAAVGPAAGWTWPLPGSPVVERGFAPPAQTWLSGHRGVDLLGRPGARVRAAGAGTVHFAGRVAGVGVVSVLHSGGLLTTYEPLRPLVRAGEAVRAGQPIGLLTRAASHCLPATCLHWGLRRGAAYLDPLALVGASRLRLFPVHGSSDQLPATITAMAVTGGLSRAGRRACRAAAAPPWCASGRSGFR